MELTDNRLSNTVNVTYTEASQGKAGLYLNY